jgi:CubicO group peptidase (beta-lactamase class C family)
MLFSRKWIAPVVFATLIIGPQTRGQEKSATPVIPAVAKAMDGFVEAGEVAGAVTLVVDEMGVVHQHVSGLADLSAKKPLSPDSIFWIASMSKPVTGVCVMMMVDEGKLNLDDPISKHLPELGGLKTDKGEPVVITVRQLLTHTSGMSELKPEETYTAKNLQEAVSRYAKLPLQFEPGSRWQYSQTSINTAARIVEVLSNKSFDAFVQERLCAPLGMKDTGFYLSEEQSQRLAKSYTRTAEGKLEEAKIFVLAGKSPTDKSRFPAANGGLFSTAADYARFCRMLIHRGEIDGKRILSEKSVKEFSSVHTGDLTTGFTLGNGWGIGCCIVREPQGVTAMLSPGSFGHGGAYGTQAWIDPVKKRAYILMTQRANFPNADASDVRKVFQQEACRALDQ